MGKDVKEAPKKVGRPYTFDREAVLAVIFDGISKGETLSELCRGEGMPSRDSVYQWAEEDPVVARRFAQARARGHDAIAEDCLKIAEDGANDWMETNDPDNPGYRLNGEHVQRSKLRIETRLKLLAKWDPKRYGERVELEHKGALSVTAMTDQQLADIAAGKGAKS